MSIPGIITLPGLAKRPSAGGNDANTVLLLHFDGADGATSTVDSAHGGAAPHSPFTFNAPSALKVAQAKFGSASLQPSATGTDGGYVSLPYSADFDFGTTTDFTMEAWIYMLAQPAPYWQFCGGNGAGFQFGMNMNGVGMNCWTPGNYHVFGWPGSPGSLPLNSWHHCAIQRAGAIWVGYVDGVQCPNTFNEAATTCSLGAGNALRIGSYSSYGLKGYMDEMRISRVARYVTSGVTPPPTSAFVLDSNTKLLSHFDGANNATSATDDTGKTLTFNGTAQLSTAKQKFGTASLSPNTDGTSLGYVSSPYSSDFDFGTADFTVELFVNFTSMTPTNQGLIGGNYAVGWQLYWNNSNKLSYWTPGNTRVMGWLGGGTPTLGTWYNIVLQRKSGTVTCWVNGTQLYTGTDTASFTLGGTNPLLIGAYDTNTPSYTVYGYIDEVRISNVARYYPAGALPSFTPPSLPYG
jgi:hypothetical protein